jgi:hypothetical protein
MARMLCDGACAASATWSGSRPAASTVRQASGCAPRSRPTCAPGPPAASNAEGRGARCAGAIDAPPAGSACGCICRPYADLRAPGLERNVQRQPPAVVRHTAGFWVGPEYIAHRALGDHGGAGRHREVQRQRARRVTRPASRAGRAISESAPLIQSSAAEAPIRRAGRQTCKPPGWRAPAAARSPVPSLPEGARGIGKGYTRTTGPPSTVYRYIVTTHKTRTADEASKGRPQTSQQMQKACMYSPPPRPAHAPRPIVMVAVHDRAPRARARWSGSGLPVAAAAGWASSSCSTSAAGAPPFCARALVNGASRRLRRRSAPAVIARGSYVWI